MLKKSSLKKIKVLKKNGKVISFQEVGEKEGVKNIFSSCFIEEENVIVRGESSSYSSSSKTLIMAIDVMSKKLRGENVFELLMIYIYFLLNFLISIT